MDKIKTAILVVNGGKDPDGGKWLTLFLDNLYRYTDKKKFQLLVWNNNVDDKNVIKLENKYNFYLVEPLSNDSLFHPHAVPLQRLFEIAKEKFRAEYIIVMDSDAFPIKKGWFEVLVDSISSNKYGLAGVWRDELSKSIKPYIHPSCMCFSTKFVIENKLKLDFYGLNNEKVKHDTLSSFTDKAYDLNLSLLKWKRSNKHNFHRLMGGIYGDFIYHHGAGSRTNIGFWDEEYSIEKSRINDKINLLSSHFIFNDLNSYISWLRGSNESKFINSISNLEYSKIEVKKGQKSFNRFKGKFGKIKKMIFNKKTNNTPNDENLVFNNMNGIPSLEMINNLGLTPKGWKESYPDIIGLGVPKAGTSWWFDMIINHPHIVPHRFYNKNNETSKELNFFSHLSHKEIDDYQKNIYRKCFLKQEGVLCAEFSTIYLHNIGILNNLINTVSSEAKFVIILRNPIDRYISHINHVMSNRVKLFELDESNEELFRKFSVLPEAHFYSLYSDIITLLMSKIEKKRLYVELYENIVLNPTSAFDDFIEFSGLSGYSNVSEDFTNHKNKQKYIAEKPNNEERKIISQYFSDDVKRLKLTLPNCDFSLWKEFN